MADVESKSIPHELPSSNWLKATGQCVLERYLSATMIGPLVAEIFEFENVYPRTDARTPDRPVYYKLTL